MSGVSVGVLTTDVLFGVQFLAFCFGVQFNWSIHTAGVSALKGTCDFIRRGREWANEGTHG
jgi:hypothetical protein